MAAPQTVSKGYWNFPDKLQTSLDPMRHLREHPIHLKTTTGAEDVELEINVRKEPGTLHKPSTLNAAYNMFYDNPILWGHKSHQLGPQKYTGTLGLNPMFPSDMVVWEGSGAGDHISSIFLKFKPGFNTLALDLLDGFWQTNIRASFGESFSLS